MTKDEALRMALEAFEDIASWYAHDRSVGALANSMYEAKCLATVQAKVLRQAIEQAEKQEPEPIAVVTGIHAGYFVVRPTDPAMVLPVNMALYTHPKEWQDLTNEEISEAYDDAIKSFRRHQMRIRGQQITQFDDPNWHFARAIEAKFKEKQND